MFYKLVCVLAVVSAVLLGEQASATPASDLCSLCENPETTPAQIVAALKAGADVNEKNKKYGWTPLMWAARYNKKPEVISALLKAGADVNAINYHGLIALDYAQNKGYLEGTQAMKELEQATNP